jgi:signal transduction histidine kinase
MDLALLAHELRGPLASLRSSLEILKRAEQWTASPSGSWSCARSVSTSPACSIGLPRLSG